MNSLTLFGISNNVIVDELRDRHIRPSSDPVTNIFLVIKDGLENDEFSALETIILSNPKLEGIIRRELREGNDTHIGFIKAVMELSNEIKAASPPTTGKFRYTTPAKTGVREDAITGNNISGRAFSIGGRAYSGATVGSLMASSRPQRKLRDPFTNMELGNTEIDDLRREMREDGMDALQEMRTPKTRKRVFITPEMEDEDEDIHMGGIPSFSLGPNHEDDSPYEDDAYTTPKNSMKTPSTFDKKFETWAPRKGKTERAKTLVQPQRSFEDEIDEFKSYETPEPPRSKTISNPKVLFSSPGSIASSPGQNKRPTSSPGRDNKMSIPRIHKYGYMEDEEEDEDF